MELRRILQKCETRVCVHYVLNRHKQEVTKIKRRKSLVVNTEEALVSVRQNWTSMKKVGKNKSAQILMNLE